MEGRQDGRFMIGVFHLSVTMPRSYKTAIRNFIFEQQKGSVSVPGMHCQPRRKKKVKQGWDVTHNTEAATHTDDRKKRKTTSDVLSA